MHATSPTAEMSGSAGQAGVVDDDAAALADRRGPASRAELVARPHAGGEDDDVGVDAAAVGEVQAADAAAPVRPDPRGRRR